MVHDIKEKLINYCFQFGSIIGMHINECNLFKVSETRIRVTQDQIIAFKF